MVTTVVAADTGVAEERRTYVKDPDAVLAYPFDWTAWLGADTVATAEAAIVGDAVVDSCDVAEDGLTVTPIVSGGTVGETCFLTVHIVTTGGLEDDRTVYLKIPGSLMEQQLIVGDSYAFTTTVAEYPATEGWTLVHMLRPRATGEAITLAATPSGSDYVTTVTAATSAQWVAGEYSVTAQVSNIGGERHTLDAVALSAGQLRSNLITILADPAEGDAIDTRSHARKVLEAIEAVLEGRATKDQEEYTIKDRSLKRTPLTDLVKFRAYYAGLVANEEAGARRAAGLPDGRTSYVRFNRV